MRNSKKKKAGKLKGPLTIENVRQQQQLFHQRSRREFVGQPRDVDEFALNSTEMRRIVFGIYLEIADFAGSLMHKVDRDAFAEKFGVLYYSLQDYRQSMGEMFPKEGRDHILRYINDVAAGAYDMVDAFLDVRAEQRPQLLYLVQRFLKGEVRLEHQRAVPTELLEAVPDQEHSQRIYAEYYEWGYRICIYDNATGQTTHPSKVVLDAAEYRLGIVGAHAREFLAAANQLAKLPSVGIVYRYFPL